MNRIKISACVAAIAVLLTIAYAQMQNQNSKMDQQKSTGQQDTASADLNADVEEWVRIGYDYDGDNVIDAYEYIFAVDLDKARQQSERRAKEQNLSPQEAGSQFESQRRLRQISGTIQATMETKLAQDEQKHLMARIRTEDDWPIIADLGPVSRVRQLNLSEGDQVKLKAKPALLNQRRIYIVTEIEADGKTISVNIPSGENKFRLFGTITKTETKTLEGRDSQPHLIALIELADGSTVPVDFGRKKDIQSLDLSTGKDVTVIVEPVTVGDRNILVAHSVGVDGRQYEIEWLKEFRQQVSRAQ